MIKGIVMYRFYANTTEFCMGEGPEKNLHRYLEIPTCSSVEGAARMQHSSRR